MTSLSIALDGPRQRDISLYRGDGASIDITVYANDGDITPIVVTDVAVTYSPGPSGQNNLAYGGFSADFFWRTNYTMTGTVSGRRTTLAYGLISAPNYVEPTCGFCDYGWWVWGYQPAITPPASDALALDGLALAIDGGLLYLE